MGDTGSVEFAIISGLIVILIGLIVYIFIDSKKVAKERDDNMDRRIDELLNAQIMFVDEMASIKKDIALIFEWQKAHEK